MTTSEYVSYGYLLLGTLWLWWGWQRKGNGDKGMATIRNHLAASHAGVGLKVFTATLLLVLIVFEIVFWPVGVIMKLTGYGDKGD